MGTRRARFFGLGLTLLATVLTGCSGFFIPQTTTPTPPTSGTGNYVFAVNPGLQTLSAYAIGTGALTLAAGSPVSLPATLVSSAAPSVAVTVSRNNAFVYVGGLNAIYCYSVGSSGVLTLVSSSSVTTAAAVVSMDTSPDGQWLFILDGASASVFEYSVNQTTGALGTVGQIVYNVPNGINVPRSVRATATVVAAALGTGGDALFTLNTTTGALVYSGFISLNNALQSDNDVALTPNGGFLFVSRSGVVGTTPANGVATFAVDVTGKPSVTGSGTLIPAGTGANSILLDGTNAYLYVANRGASTVSEYAVSAAGAVAPLATPPFPVGLVVTSLARDSTGKYVFAGGIGSTSDLQMYTFDVTTGGKLDSAMSVSTGSDTQGLQIATTH